MKTKDGIEITKEDFENYLRAQKSGRFNMFSSEARELTGLSKQQYSAVLKNYSELVVEYEESYNRIIGG